MEILVLHCEKQKHFLSHSQFKAWGCCVFVFWYMWFFFFFFFNKKWKYKQLTMWKLTLIITSLCFFRVSFSIYFIRNCLLWSSLTESIILTPSFGEENSYIVPFPPFHEHVQAMLLGTDIIRIMAPALREIAVQHGGREQLQSNIIIISGIINQGLQWA